MFHIDGSSASSPFSTVSTDASSPETGQTDAKSNGQAALYQYHQMQSQQHHSPGVPNFFANYNAKYVLVTLAYKCLHVLTEQWENAALADKFPSTNLPSTTSTFIIVQFRHERARIPTFRNTKSGASCRNFDTPRRNQVGAA